jgi:hypothetical protein
LVGTCLAHATVDVLVELSKFTKRITATAGAILTVAVLASVWSLSGLRL